MASILNASSKTVSWIKFEIEIEFIIVDDEINFFIDFCSLPENSATEARQSDGIHSFNQYRNDKAYDTKPL